MIDSELAAFLQQGVGIHIGTRDNALQPEGARAVAVKVDDDGVHVELYVSDAAAARVLPNLEANGQAAVTFARPVDDRALQLKGTFVAAREASQGDRPYVSAQWERFLDQLELIGIPRAGAAQWRTWPVVAIRLKTTALFDQTPGARAGTPLA